MVVFCSDLRHVADDLGVLIVEVAVNVTVELQGDPPIATSANMEVDCRTTDGSVSEIVIEKARSTCMVSNSLRQGVPVAITSKS